MSRDNCKRRTQINDDEGLNRRTRRIQVAEDFEGDDFADDYHDAFQAESDSDVSDNVNLNPSPARSGDEEAP